MLDAALAACQRQIPNVRWHIQQGVVMGEIYGTALEVIVTGNKAFARVGGSKRCRPSSDIANVVDVLRDSMVRRRDALTRALEGAIVHTEHPPHAERNRRP